MTNVPETYYTLSVKHALIFNKIHIYIWSLKFGASYTDIRIKKGTMKTISLNSACILL